MFPYQIRYITNNRMGSVHALTYIDAESDAEAQEKASKECPSVKGDWQPMEGFSDCWMKGEGNQYEMCLTKGKLM